MDSYKKIAEEAVSSYACFCIEMVILLNKACYGMANSVDLVKLIEQNLKKANGLTVSMRYSDIADELRNLGEVE